MRFLFNADGGNGGGGTGEENQGGTGNQGGAAGNNGGLKQGDAGYDAELQRARNEAAESRRKLREMEDKEREREETVRKEAERVAAEQGQFKELYEGAQSEIATLKARVKELEPFEAKVTEIETARRTELIARLPEAARPDFEGASIAEIERAVKLIPAQLSTQTVKPNGAGAEAAGNEGSKDPLQMTAEDLDALRTSDPAAYREAIAARRQKTSSRRGLFG